jgi:hypothetical protein
MSMNQSNMGQPRPSSARRLGNFGILSAIASLFLLSEIFGSVAIILGAYAMRSEPDSRIGIIVVILGITCMLIGIYVTAVPLVIDLIYGY